MFTSKADTITTMEADLKTVVAWAKGQAFPEGRFILAGHSLGAMTAMKYAHDYPEHIEMVIPVAPTISKKIAGEVGSLNDDEVTALGDVDLIALAPTILSQVLLIVGDSDPKTPADTQEKLFGLLGSAEKGLHIITTKDTSAPANHSLRNKPNVEALRKIVSQGIRGTLTNEH